MSNELTTANFIESEIKVMKEMANLASSSPFFKSLGGVGGVFSIMMYARALKLDPWQCIFGGMKCIQGRVEIAPVMMNALMRKAGHKIEVLRSDDEICVLKGIRSDSGETVTVSFSVEDAKRAKIYRAGGGWETYPSDMCWARAISKLCRRLCPDVIGASYVEGEISEADVRTVETTGFNDGSNERCEDINNEISIQPELRIQKLSQAEIDEMAASLIEIAHPEDPSGVRAFIEHCQNAYLAKGLDIRALPNKVEENPETFLKAYAGWIKTRTA